MRRSLLFALLAVFASVGVVARSAADNSTPRPVLPKAQGETCVEPVETMRALHGAILAATNGSSSTSSLPKHELSECVACHAQRDKAGAYIPVDAPGQFCQSCHSYSAVSINCFSCHASTPKAGVSKQSAALSTADHSKFDILKQPFASGAEVTYACLSCHTEAGKQLRGTEHWQLTFANPATGQTLGKAHTINMFFGATASNEGLCSNCHIDNAMRDFASDSNVDCLVCHDTTGFYRKPRVWTGKSALDDLLASKGAAVAAPVDLSFIAGHVGKTSRETCGSCHFYADGGDGAKHGDLDSSLTNPKRPLDVHMATDGLNFTCATCHVSKGHDFSGSRYATVARETHGINTPGHMDSNPATCESCHGSKPHKADPHKPAIYAKLNEHTDRVACETCHIPTIARGGVPTKVSVDWSTAGKTGADGKPLKILDAQGRATYTTETGGAVWGEKLVPSYAWSDGTVRYTQLGDKIDPKTPVALNRFEGGAEDANARIWPFKVMKGKQPYDSGGNTLASAHLFGGDAGYWSAYEWNRSIAVAMNAAGSNYSGAYGFVETEMSLPLAHMVAPATQALQCNDCHSGDSRIAHVGGVYAPGRDSFRWLDWLGWLAVAASFVGVSAHGIARWAFARHRRQRG